MKSKKSKTSKCIKMSPSALKINRHHSYSKNYFVMTLIRSKKAFFFFLPSDNAREW